MASRNVRRKTDNYLMTRFLEEELGELESRNEEVGLEANEPKVCSSETVEDEEVLFDELRSLSSGSCEDEDEGEKEVDNRSMEVKLLELIVMYYNLFHYSRPAATFLLAGLRAIGVPAPKSYKTIERLMSEDHPKGKTTPMGNGHFRYVSIANNLQVLSRNNLLHLKPQYLQHEGPEQVYKFEAIVNCDGLPLYHSSGFGLWPILMKIPAIFARPFPVAVWAGIGKPAVTEYLHEFCQEASQFLSRPVKVAEKVSFIFSTIYFVCDAPARAFIMATLNHNSYHGCSYCRAIGPRVDNRVTYSVTVGESRCGKMYHAELEANQKTKKRIRSPLLDLPNIDFVNSFPLDYQHAVCLGVVRKLMNFYFGKGPACDSKLNPTQLCSMSDKITVIASWTPSNFQRRPRRIDSNLKFMKATEFRQFLLYVGPILFRGYVKEKFLNHFLLLHFALYVYSSPRFSHLWDQAKRSLEEFVGGTAKLFGQKSVSYNIHAMLHLDQFVRQHGDLNYFSTFAFENYLGAVKRSIKVTRNLAEHSVRQVFRVRKQLLSHHTIPPLSYRTKKGDNCCFVDKDLCVFIEEIAAGGEVSGRILRPDSDVYTYPYESLLLGIGVYRLSSQVVRSKPMRKCWLWPKNAQNADRFEAGTLFYVVPFAGDAD